MANWICYIQPKPRCVLHPVKLTGFLTRVLGLEYWAVEPGMRLVLEISSGDWELNSWQTSIFASSRRRSRYDLVLPLNGRNDRKGHWNALDLSVRHNILAVPPAEHRISCYWRRMSIQQYPNKRPFIDLHTQTNSPEEYRARQCYVYIPFSIWRNNQRIVHG